MTVTCYKTHNKLILGYASTYFLIELVSVSSSFEMFFSIECRYMICGTSKNSWYRLLSLSSWKCSDLFPGKLMSVDSRQTGNTGDWTMSAWQTALIPNIARNIYKDITY